MKTKALIIIFASLATLGCGGNTKENTVSAESPAYWTEVTRQKEPMITMTTYVDPNGHVIVTRDTPYGTSVTQIK